MKHLFFIFAFWMSAIVFAQPHRPGQGQKQQALQDAQKLMQASRSFKRTINTTPRSGLQAFAGYELQSFISSVQSLNQFLRRPRTQLAGAFHLYQGLTQSFVDLRSSFHNQLNIPQQARRDQFYFVIMDSYMEVAQNYLQAISYQQVGPQPGPGPGPGPRPPVIHPVPPVQPVPPANVVATATGWSQEFHGDSAGSSTARKRALSACQQSGISNCSITRESFDISRWRYNAWAAGSKVFTAKARNFAQAQQKALNKCRQAGMMKCSL